MAPRKTKPQAQASESSEAGRSSSSKPKVKSMREMLFSYVKSGKAGLFLQTYEETRAESEIKSIADELSFRLYSWSLTQGLVCVSDNPPTQTSDTNDPVEMLEAFQKLPAKSIVLARDLHMLLGDSHNPNPMLVRKIKDAIKVGTTTNRVLICVGCRFVSIAELEKEWAVVEFSLPDKETLNGVLAQIATSASIEMNGNRDPILAAGSGLTTQEFSDATAMSVVECGNITAEIVSREKASTVRKNGVLELIDTVTGASDIGGLDLLKEWLNKRKRAFSDKARDYGLPIPKGVLLLGPPGAGKSLTAKATASIFGVPLLKMDGGKLFGGLVGESEGNIRSAIQTAEAIAPCVVFVDELEKSFSGSKSSGSTDGGTSARVLGTFLNWLQEKTARVFVVATANDVSQLPPELLRKGRWDEMFVVDLPNKAERVAIWKVHIAKRGRNPDKFDLERLAERTDGFTGAEIEASVNEGLFNAFDQDMEIEDRHLTEAVTSTVPLSRTMSAQIDALRAWATGRARRASSQDQTQASATRKLA